MERKLALRVGIVAGVVGAAAGGVAYSAIPHPLYGDTTACYRTSNGALRVIDTAAGDTCRASERSLGLYQGYVQLIRRPNGPNGTAGAGTFQTVVASSLLGSNLPVVYAITAKTIISTKDPSFSRCRLVAENEEEGSFTLDESRNEAAVQATHNLQGILFVPADVRLNCAASADWTAAESSIMGIKVGKGAAAVTDLPDPVTP